MPTSPHSFQSVVRTQAFKHNPCQHVAGSGFCERRRGRPLGLPMVHCYGGRSAKRFRPRLEQAESERDAFLPRLADEWGTGRF